MFRRRHQLNEEETRIYAAGMAACRRGENQPKQELPFEQYKIWRAGWNRVGRPLYNSRMRSRDHNTLCEGVHCIHTEVETFDDALKVLAIRQQHQPSLKTSPTWRQQLKVHEARKKSPKGHALVGGQSDSPSEFELHIIGRVITAVQSLKLGVEEASAVSAMGVKFPALNPKALMDIIVSLCKLIKQDAPVFNVQRAPVAHMPVRYCVDCGTPLEKSELEYCRHCNPETESLRIASQFRREHYAQLGGLERETKQLSKMITKVKRKVIDHGSDEGHSGHPGQIGGGLEAGGREENLVIGGETPHQPGASGTGNTES